MARSQMSIKAIKELFSQPIVDRELLTACQNDGRKGVQTILRRYRKAQDERERLDRLYRYEDLCRRDGFGLIAGTDEAGRGPLAGPVAAAAVILPPHLFLPRLNDSKKLSPAVRDELFEEITAQAVAYKISMVEPREIDRTNILLATQKAMTEAILGLAIPPQMVITDAMRLPNLPFDQWPIVRGDSKSASVAAASILAKVARDRKMLEYDEKYPAYGFARHKGYGTKLHLEALQRYGPCPIHRLTFEPIGSMLTAEKFRRLSTELPIDD